MLLLLDGQSLLYTCFYATIPKQYIYAKTEAEKQKALKNVMQNSEGLFTNGVYAMTKKLLKIVQTIRPEYIAVAWDKSRNTFRRDIYQGYKGNRDKIKPELAQQIELMQGVLNAMGISQFDHPEYEADDIIGTLSRQFQEKVPVRILTKDRDAMQLVSDQVHVWLTNGTKHNKNDVPDGCQEFNPSQVKETFGVYPDQVADLKALMGDTSDNIPGVPGIGEKTAIPLINEFGSIEELYFFVSDPYNEEGFTFLLYEMGIKRSPLKALLSNRESAFMSKKLATIAGVPIDASLAELAYSFDIPKLNSIFKKLEFNSLKSIA